MPDINRQDCRSEFHVTLENRVSGQSVRLATVTNHGKDVEICQTFDAPLSVSLTELLIGSRQGTLSLNDGSVSSYNRVLAAGKLMAAVGILREVADMKESGIGLDAAIQCIDSAIQNLGD